MSGYFIDIVDEKNNLLGTERDINFAHEKGLWHRNVHIWVYTKKGEILFQKRSKNNYLFPGLFDITVGSHIMTGDTYDDAAIYSLKHKIGLDAHPNQLASLGVTAWQKDFKNNAGHLIKNREFRKIFLLGFDGTIKDLNLKKDEISEVQLFKISELKKILFESTLNKEFVPHAPEYYLIILNAVQNEIKRQKKK